MLTTTPGGTVILRLGPGTEVKTTETTSNMPKATGVSDARFPHCQAASLAAGTTSHPTKSVRGGGPALRPSSLIQITGESGGPHEIVAESTQFIHQILPRDLLCARYGLGNRSRGGNRKAQASRSDAHKRRCTNQAVNRLPITTRTIKAKASRACWDG